MAGPYRRKKSNRGYTKDAKYSKTKRRIKNLDQVNDDLKPKNADKLLKQPEDLDLPGAGQFYCLHCARHFIDDKSLQDHFKTKVHKKRLRDMEDEPYTQKEAEAAAGMGCYLPPKKRKIETQKPLEEKDL